jgi:alpha-1,6-mannosyltransferase
MHLPILIDRCFYLIGIKLTPLMLGPWLVLSWQKNKVLPFLGFSCIFIILLFAPLFYSNGIQNFWSSIRLFQSTFEFNASFYYIVNSVYGFFIGYNPIAYVGPTLNFIAFFGIVFYCVKNKGQDIERVLIGIVHIYLIYLLSQDVVHSWYIIPAFGVSILTKSNFFFSGLDRIGTFILRCLF